MLSDGCEDQQAELHLNIAMCSARLSDFSTAQEHVSTALEKLAKLEHMTELEPLALDAQLLNAELLLRSGKYVPILKLVKAVEEKYDLEPPERWHYAQGFQLMRGFAFAGLKQNLKATEALGAVSNSYGNEEQGPGILPPFGPQVASSIKMPASVLQAGLVCQARAQMATMVVVQRQPVMWNGFFSMAGIFSFPPMPEIELQRTFFESPTALAAEVWDFDQTNGYGNE